MKFPISDHCDGKRFFNPGDPGGNGLLDLLRWRLTSKPAPWPARVEVTPVQPPRCPNGSGAVATWVGHSCFLIQTEQGNFLTDPVYSDRIGPVSWAGPRPAAGPGMTWESLPRIDAVLLSHDHYDHCDLPTLRAAARRWGTPVIAPLGHKRLLKSSGIETQIVELDWWQGHALASGASAALVPARHWTRRTPFGTNFRLWGGFMIRAGGRLIYFAGDSGYDNKLFSEIGRRVGHPDLAMIPIGAYEPRWFMADSHMNPAEAVQVHRDVGARLSVAMHWGTFQLTDEGRDDPPKALAEALRTQGVPDTEFIVLPPGGSATV